MPETTTIPKTVEVPIAALCETIGYLEHLADVIGVLNGRQTTPAEDNLNMAAERLTEASGFDRDWERMGPRIIAARERHTKRWLGDLSDGPARSRLQTRC